VEPPPSSVAIGSPQDVQNAVPGALSLPHDVQKPTDASPLRPGCTIVGLLATGPGPPGGKLEDVRVGVSLRDAD